MTANARLKMKYTYTVEDIQVDAPATAGSIDDELSAVQSCETRKDLIANLEAAISACADLQCELEDALANAQEEEEES